MPGSNRELFNAAHYNVIAKRIRETREVHKYATQTLQDAVTEAIDMIVNDLADWFSEDNPRFERDTWMEATNTHEPA